MVATKNKKKLFDALSALGTQTDDMSREISAFTKKLQVGVQRDTSRKIKTEVAHLKHASERMIAETQEEIRKEHDAALKLLGTGVLEALGKQAKKISAEIATIHEILTSQKEGGEKLTDFLNEKIATAQEDVSNLRKALVSIDVTSAADTVRRELKPQLADLNTRIVTVDKSLSDFYEKVPKDVERLRSEILSRLGHGGNANRAIYVDGDTTAAIPVINPYIGNQFFQLTGVGT